MKRLAWLFVFVVAGCTCSPLEPHGPVMDPRTPYDLAAALYPDESEDEAGFDPAAWSGRRYRWWLRFVPQLCARPDACRMLPFDHRKTGGRAQGWLPNISLDSATYRRLLALCSDKERCVARFEGNLSIRAEPGLPPEIVLDNTTVLQARSARSNESWVARRPSLSGLRKHDAAVRDRSDSR